MNYLCFVFFLPFQSFFLVVLSSAHGVLAAASQGGYVCVCVIAHCYRAPIEKHRKIFAFKLDFKFSNSYILFLIWGQNVICLDLNSSLIKWRWYLPCLFQTRIHSEVKKKSVRILTLPLSSHIFLDLSTKFLGLAFPIGQSDTKYTHMTEFLLILNELMEVKVYRTRLHISEPLKKVDFINLFSLRIVWNIK